MSDEQRKHPKSRSEKAEKRPARPPKNSGPRPEPKK